MVNQIHYKIYRGLFITAGSYNNGGVTCTCKTIEIFHILCKLFVLSCNYKPPNSPHSMQISTHYKQRRQAMSRLATTQLWKETYLVLRPGNLVPRARNNN